MEFSYTKWATPKEFDNSLLLPSCWWRTDYTPLKKCEAHKHLRGLFVFLPCLACSKCVLALVQQRGKKTGAISKLRRPTVSTSASPFRHSTRWNERASRGMETDARESRTAAVWCHTLPERERKKRKRKSAPSAVSSVLLQLVPLLERFLRMHLQTYCIIVTVRIGYYLLRHC